MYFIGQSETTAVGLKLGPVAVNEEHWTLL